MTKESSHVRGSIFQSAARAVASCFRHRLRKQARIETTLDEASCETMADTAIINHDAEAEVRAMSNGAATPAFAPVPVGEFSAAALNVAPSSMLEETGDEADILELPPIFASMLSNDSMDILEETGTGKDAQIAACFAGGATILNNSHAQQDAVLDFAAT
jgi:hypothetical protein